ncbi:N-acyl homoserine lactonase family protein [Galbitalea sp. SE-J8]|uniref:N-acyl homoserine lactonase family protein n=1 Tax=Galbitalea sp. SE-J8 TaxID=3054952 RepID=UPI00259C8E5F|nr:N-acyl homoserine lactonase family protein [Galbitalea sp. SE-J8]MDM4762981.1 N-acyl homoserine lactonase family protein [Galbitalea sp. SE-J8]
MEPAVPGPDLHPGVPAVHADPRLDGERAMRTSDARARTADGERDRRIYALRYGTRSAERSEIYLNYRLYGEADRVDVMDYFVWVVRDAGGVTLIDTGYNIRSGGRRGRTMLIEPPAALAAIGIGPTEVDRIVVTHGHYDHTGNVEAFPNAQVIMARAEFDFWTGPYANRIQFADYREAEDIAHLSQLAGTPRLVLLDDTTTIAPGVRARIVGGHTPGQLLVEVDDAAGTVVIASDVIHYYEEVERDMPFAVVSDVPGMYHGYEMIRSLAANAGTRVVAGHDPEVMRRFPPIAGHPGLGVMLSVV